MTRLLIIADDFTGALDTGVQFAKSGAATRVLVRPDEPLRRDEGAAVLVLNAESRHLPPREAYNRVHRAVREALDAGIPRIYKKTDSALRGNLGAELAAVVDAAGEGLAFVPAYPAAGRTTSGGVHCIDGVPVARSVFGSDPFEPVRNSRVREILAEQTALPIAETGGERLPAPVPGTIHVFDSENQRQMERVAAHVATRWTHMAGCAGLAGCLPPHLGLCGAAPPLPETPSPLLVVSGSVNPVTLRQNGRARDLGFPVFTLAPDEKLAPDLRAHPGMARRLQDMRAACAAHRRLLVAAAESPEDVARTDALAAQRGLPPEEVRARVAANLGGTAAWLAEACGGTLAVFGGDTLQAALTELGANRLRPVTSLEDGVILSLLERGEVTRPIITKSGGLGSGDTLSTLLSQCKMTGHEEESR